MSKSSIKNLLIAFALVPALAFAQASATKPAAKPAAKAAAKAPKSAAVEKAVTAPVGGNSKVRFTTSLGNFTVELYPDKAPKSVENVLAYVKSGFYNGTVFHRVIDGFMIQGGGFTRELKQKPTRPAIPNEANNGLSNMRGTLALARTGDPNSATSQFFINVADNKRLDFVSDANGATWGYAVFGKITDGLDVIDKIRVVPTGAQGPFASDVPTTPVVIEKAEVVQ